MTNLPGANSKERHTNKEGGSQSVLKAAYHLLPPLALYAVAVRLEFGRQHYDIGMNGIDPPDSSFSNWRKIPVHEHVQHAMMHLLAYQAGDDTDHVNEDLSPRVGHLAALCTRGLMALELAVQHDIETRIEPKPSTLKPVEYRNLHSGETIKAQDFDGSIPRTIENHLGHPVSTAMAEHLKGEGWTETLLPSLNKLILYPPRH